MRLKVFQMLKWTKIDAKKIPNFKENDHKEVEKINNYLLQLLNNYLISTLNITNDNIEKKKWAEIGVTFEMRCSITPNWISM